MATRPGGPGADPSRKFVRLAIVDDHPMIRAGLIATLRSEPDFEIVGIGETADHAIDIAARELPDVMFIDISLPGDGIEAIRQLSLAFPAVKSIVLTVHDDVQSIKRAFLAGASGYLNKSISSADLVTSARRVASGEFQVPPTVAIGILTVDNTDATTGFEVPFALTDREREILSLLAEGKTNGDVGALLALPERTIEKYLTNILRKLHVRSRVESAMRQKLEH